MKKFFIPDTLKIGECYSNDQIKYALEVANLGGIRPKIKNKELDFIVLITSLEETKNKIRNPYADKIEGDILTYQKLQVLGIDSVRIDKIDDFNFEINFAKIGSYEKFQNISKY